MEESTYDIYFRGEIADGYALDDVKVNVAKVFSADENKVNALFSGKTCLLKKGIDKQTALKYQTVLKKAGAKIIIKTSETAEASNQNAASAAPVPTEESTSPADTATAQSADATPATNANADGLQALPVGSDLLSATERPTVEPVEVDTSNISLASIFDAPQAPEKDTPPAPDTGHLSVAEVGAALLPDAVVVDLPFPDVSALDIAEVGTLLLDEHEEIPLPEPDTSAMSLAPVGERLTEEDTSEPPPPPDTSHLKVETE